eukprot:47824-Chlamydomonas_euryale.AAC.1
MHLAPSPLRRFRYKPEKVLGVSKGAEALKIVQVPRSACVHVRDKGALRGGERGGGGLSIRTPGSRMDACRWMFGDVCSEMEALICAGASIARKRVRMAHE